MKTIVFNFLLFVYIFSFAVSAHAQAPVRVVVAGLNHDHIHGILSQYDKGVVDIVGIAETDKKLWKKYGDIYHVPDSLFYTDLKKLVIRKKPAAVLGYNAVARHVDIVEICAPLGIAVMVEKPLAATLAQATRMQELVKKFNIQVLTNYETTWYASYQQVFNMVASDSIGPIKKMVAHDGHQGPKEIGCSADFLQWLTDPVLNGAGALNDFGCYGADLMTWLMHGERPIAVTAVTRKYKPLIYPNVDDDATIIVEYKSATGLIEASWNWPFGIKDLEVFGEHGYLHALDKDHLNFRMRERRTGMITPDPLPAPVSDPLLYLSAVLQNDLPGRADQSSFEYNMIVMEILDAAKRSAESGERVEL